MYRHIRITYDLLFGDLEKYEKHKKANDKLNVKKIRGLKVY